MQQHPIYRWLISLIILMVSFLVSGKTFVNAEALPTIQSPPRLKIGLALGGGAAGGFAQIGILEWLEEHHIPVDNIAGTSMGGLLGACYSMGMSPQDLVNLVKSIDWNKMFNPVPPYNSMSFRRKEDQQDYPLSGLGLRNGKLTLPSGLNVYKVDMILSRVTLKYSLIKSFDDLPIPFKCIATDIRSGESVVLENGSLEKALRATMSIPGVFNPVDYDGRLLVDGGILNNVPVDVAKKMGADVVIAVNIASPLPNNRSENIGTVISRTLDTVTAQNVKKSISHADVVIAPSITELGLFQWGAAKRYIQLGYQATEQQKAALLKYALDESSWQQYLQDRQKRYLKIAPIPQNIAIEGTSDIYKTNIEKRFQKYIGRPVDIALLEEDLTSLMGSDLYEGLSYEFAVENNQPVLKILLHEKTYGPPFISSKLQMTFSPGESQDNIAARITSLNIAGPYSEMRVDLGLGTEPAFRTELYKPFSGNKWFIAPAFFFKKTDGSLYDVSRRVSDYQISNYGLNCDLGYNVNEFSEIRLGYVEGHQHTEIIVGEPLNSDYNGKIQQAHLQWVFSSADDPLLPMRGLSINSDARWYFDAPDSDE
ncbi:MAG TPA: hypothetical protein DDW50_12700, partial [Firmicutes bacterium]|nr:hypothetical protein [Bacillota bacterium]